MLYSPESNLAVESDYSSNYHPTVFAEHIWQGGIPVAEVDTGGPTTHWTMTDHLGTPILWTDSTPAVTWRVEHEPYGRVFVLRAGSDLHQPLRLPGQEAEQLPNIGINGATEKSYNIFRWYRYNWGRYTQADRLGLTDSVNLFGYGLSNPNRYSDPLGLSVLLRCRDVGTPGKFEPGSASAVLLFGAKHCFMQVTCPSEGIPPTLISYLGRMTVAPSNASRNNDAAYSQSGDYAQTLVKPSGPNGCCGFERCLIRSAQALKGRRLANYGIVSGATSNTVAQRLINGCGASPFVVPAGGAYGWGRPIEPQWQEGGGW